MILYNLYVNGVLWDKFKTIKEIDEFIFEKGIENEYIEVKKEKVIKNVKRNKKK